MKVEKRDATSAPPKYIKQNSEVCKPFFKPSPFELLRKQMPFWMLGGTVRNLKRKYLYFSLPLITLQSATLDPADLPVKIPNAPNVLETLSSRGMEKFSIDVNEQKQALEGF